MTPVNSWKLSITQTVLDKLSELQHKRHEHKEGIFKEEGRDWQVYGRDMRMESNQDALYKHKKLSKPKFFWQKRKGVQLAHRCEGFSFRL